MPWLSHTSATMGSMLARYTSDRSAACIRMGQIEHDKPQPNSHFPYVLMSARRIGLINYTALNCTALLLTALH